MGTFHQGKSALHGITVVVDTRGKKVFIGRCEDEDDEHVILNDVDVHEDGENGRSKADYVKRAAKFGTWKKHDQLVIPREDVTTITRLGEVEPLQTQLRPKAEAAAAEAPKISAAAVDAPTDAIVKLTPNAQAEVRRLIQEQGGAGLGLRLGVKGGGCSGLSYKLEFDQKKEGDFVIQYGDINVYLDRKSTIYLRGITLDHQKGLAGRGFVFQNPNATNTCGCGESFSV